MIYINATLRLNSFSTFVSEQAGRLFAMTEKKTVGSKDEYLTEMGNGNFLTI